MKWDCKKFEIKDETQWDDFIAKESINGTILHTRKFLNHNPLNAVDDYSLLFYKNGKIGAVMPATLSKSESSSIVLHSHPRITYGGFVTGRTVGIADAIEIVQKMLLKAKEVNADEIIVRNPFRVFQQTFADESDYAMWLNGFSIKYREIEVAIDLRGDFLTEIQKRYDNGTKYNIKKAYKFVKPKLTNDYAAFWTMLEKNLAEKHQLKPVHTYNEFETLRSLIDLDSIRLIGGFIDDRMVCGVVLFVIGSHALHAQYVASDADYQEFRPINAVLDFIIQWGNTNKFHYFNLGTPNESNGYKLNNGLAHFKESFGGRGVLRETMHLTL